MDDEVLGIVTHLGKGRYVKRLLYSCLRTSVPHLLPYRFICNGSTSSIYELPIMIAIDRTLEISSFHQKTFAIPHKRRLLYATNS